MLKKRRISYLIVLVIGWLVMPTTVTAGIIKGTIKTAEGELLPFATIYVKALKIGTAANAEGYYEVKLPEGNYEVVFQYLGYQTQTKQIKVVGEETIVNIALSPQAVMLREVEVKSGKEDPAYTIMRKAIAKSKFHTQQLDYYKATIYIKGSGRLINAPFFVRKQLKKEGIDPEAAYALESVNEITYRRPNQYEEKVISIKKIGNDNDTPPNQYINGSFYDDKLGDAISPLSRKALAYYNFTYLGAFEDRGYTINKIKVTPRSKGDNVFAGVIYIIEDYWSIHSVNLVTTFYGIEFQVKQVYAPIKPTAWLPISHEFEVRGAVLGFDFEYDYLATVSGYDIRLNPQLDEPLTVVDEKIEKTLADSLDNTNQSLEEAFKQASKQKEISRKQLSKLLDEYEKEEKKKSNTPRVVSNYTYKVDSLARDKDSTYWGQVRPVPLTQRERLGYRKLDSVQVAKADKQDTLKTKENAFGPGDLIVGNVFSWGDKTKFKIRNLVAHFNTVEGFNFTHGFAVARQKSKINSWQIGPRIRYAEARNKWTGVIEGQWNYGRSGRLGQLSLEAGRYVRQFNPQNPIHPFVNDFTTLLLERNFMKIYEQDFIQVTNRKNIFSNLTLSTGATVSKRNPLFNNSDYTVIDSDSRDFTANAPVNISLTDTQFETHNALIVSAKIEYAPWQQYRIYNGLKSKVPKTSPVFSLSYRQGIEGPVNSATDFSHIDIGYRHTFDVGVRGLMDIAVNAGRFINKDQAFFMDYRHFIGNQTPFQVTKNVGSFRLLEYYRYSTLENYLEAHLHYQFRKFLLTQLPVVKLLGIREQVMVNHLNTPQSSHYTELGYSINYIFRVFRLEAIAAFEDGKYLDMGVRVGIAANLGVFSSNQ